MDGSAFLVATRATVVAVAGALVVLLAIRAVRAPAGARALFPTAALVVMLVSIAVSLLLGDARFAQLWFAAFPVLLATYPDGRFVPRWIVWPVAAGALWYLAEVVSGHRLSAQPWWWIVPVGELLIVGAQVYRYLRRSTTAERESVRWALLGTVLGVELYLVLAIAGAVGGGGAVGEGGAVNEGLANLAVVPILLGPAVGLLRPRLWNVDAAFRSLLVATLAAPVLAAAYWAASGIASLGGAGTSAAGWWGAAAVTVLAVPVIGGAARLATRIVYRGRTDAALAVARLAERLDNRSDQEAVAVVIVRSVVDALFLDGAALHGEVFAAHVGELPHVGEQPDPGVERFPIVFHGEELGVLSVPPRPGESSLTALDREVVGRIALHSAPALHGARALAELGEAHTRLLLAREEERKRLRRDLHDDLSPTLSGLSLGAAALAKRAASIDAELSRQAAELHEDIQAAVVQSREIAYGLRPPILDDRGLVAAIRDRVHGQSADALAVEVIAPEGALGLPAAVDLAALRIVQEAVANVRRHAQAGTCRITLERRGDELHVQVDDDGIGMPRRAAGGLGLASIRERALELGGTARFGNTPSGGARVSVRLPVPSWVAA
ncbi:sensor histidine kinase [Agromyces sp. NPDC055520]